MRLTEPGPKRAASDHSCQPSYYPFALSHRARGNLTSKFRLFRSKSAFLIVTNLWNLAVTKAMFHVKHFLQLENPFCARFYSAVSFFIGGKNPPQTGYRLLVIAQRRERIDVRSPPRGYQSSGNRDKTQQQQRKKDSIPIQRSVFEAG